MTDKNVLFFENDFGKKRFLSNSRTKRSNGMTNGKFSKLLRFSSFSRLFSREGNVISKNLDVNVRRRSNIKNGIRTPLARS